MEQLEARKSNLGIISYLPEAGTLKLERGDLPHEGLNRALKAGLTIPWPPAPHDYIPFDCDSDDVEIALAVTTSIASQALRRRKSFTPPDICRDAIRYWDVIHNKHRKALAARIERVIENLLLVGYTGQFEIVSKTHTFAVEVTASAMRASRQDPNGYARKLMSMGKIAIEEMKQKLDREQREGELPLFKGTVLPPVRRSTRRRRR